MLDWIDRYLDVVDVIGGAIVATVLVVMCAALLLSPLVLMALLIKEVLVLGG